VLLVDINTLSVNRRINCLLFTQNVSINGYLLLQ